MEKQDMSWNDMIRRMLPSIKIDNADGTYKIFEPHTTSPYGATNRPPNSSNPHKGVDFNYLGGRDLPLNKSNPAIRSPVSGVIENAGQGDYGTISIRDANGYLHQVLHTHRRHVNVGDPVVAGQLIGTMGNTGVKARGVEGGDAHVH
jgi:murein DD-endopeptidase MepM/ murein hydrolase activator NlpD